MLSKEELMEKAASYAKKGDKKGFAEIMVEFVQPQHITTDYVSLLLNARNLKPGDILAKKIRKGLKVWTHVPGTVPMKGEITITERANYIMDMAQISVTANVWELEQGDIGTVESLRSEMQAKLKDFYMGKVFTALTTIWNASNTPDNYVDAGSVVTKTALDTMINTVIRLNGSVQGIFGVRDALLPITEFAGWNVLGTNTAYNMSVEVSNELARTGWVGSYKGIPLNVIPRDINNPEDNQVLVPTNKILVVGKNVGDFVTFGDTLVQEYTKMDMVPAQWNLTIAEQFGFIVDSAQGIGVIKTANT